MSAPDPAFPTAASAPLACGRFRVAVEYAIGGDARYISHHDELRALTRVLARAAWPLTFSQGFNPHPRVVLPLPRSVGSASECQLMLVDLREPRAGRELAESLAAALPDGLSLVRVTAPAPQAVPQARTCTYEIELEAIDARNITPRVCRILAADRLWVARGFGPDKPTRKVDIRPYIDALVIAGTVLRIRLRFETQRTARPSEVLAELGLDHEVYAGRLRRVDIAWDRTLAGPTARPAAAVVPSASRAKADATPTITATASLTARAVTVARSVAPARAAASPAAATASRRPEP